ncbi:MAG TPA: hypothetical protein PKE26_00395 [Kiritimatiellia bacterium]|nr:hypothetical protein [Kiritimatiellia bacterium]HMO97552.1 hypothetical protein [Kiritimatiellia bacterium]HMP95962.1 hypothetical protein [Kiritimatiellia bacterium]
MKLFAGTVALTFTLIASTPGQTLSFAPETPEVTSPGANNLQSLEALQRALAMKEAELTRRLDDLATATDDSLREEIRADIRELRIAIEDQRRQFDGFAANIDLSPFTPQAPAKFDWQEQIGKLLEPIMAEIENATSESRLIGHLRGQIDDVRKRRDLAQKAVDNLRALLAQPASPELEQRLTARLETWTRTLDQAENEYTALDLQLQSRLAARESVLDQSARYARHFFRTRGMNLLLGLLAFSAVFFGFRLADYLMHRAKRARGAKSFSTRLTTLLFHVFSVLGGLLAMMVIFNLAGDWFLLGIIVIFLFGVGWAGIKTLPQQIETIKLMLNIGAVREGEVIVYEGTTYRVDTLGFAARLSNPALDGGTRLLPVKYLVGMTSRPVGPNEPWFPSRVGDWVELADGTAGKIISQTPGSVQLEALGGSRAVYRTPDYLAQSPRNLSGGFRIETRFGIDCRHQAIANTEIPAILSAQLREGLATAFGAEAVRGVEVALAKAASSALEYAIAIDLAGDAAARARDIRLAITRIAVDTCNERGWVIPFNQVTVHQG